MIESAAFVYLTFAMVGLIGRTIVFIFQMPFMWRRHKKRLKQEALDRVEVEHYLEELRSRIHPAWVPTPWPPPPIRATLRTSQPVSTPAPPPPPPWSKK